MTELKSIPTTNFKESKNVFNAVFHPLKWKILLHLESNPGSTVTEITKKFKLMQPVASSLLKDLRWAGVVKRTSKGKSMLYSVNTELIEQLKDWSQLIVEARKANAIV